MNKPYIICHMGSTVDGRIIGEHWGENSGKFEAMEVGDYLPKKSARPLKVIDVQKLEHDVLWPRYKFKVNIV